MLKTERLRVIALIVVATVVVVYIVVATAVGLGTVDPRRLATGYVIFVLFEATVLVLITDRIKQGGDVPQLRRYFNALVETSVPSVVIATHMSNMGAAQALAFVGPSAIAASGASSIPPPQAMSKSKSRGSSITD